MKILPCNKSYNLFKEICNTFYRNFVEINKEKLFNNLKHDIMGSLLYAVAVILVIIWAIGFFAYSAGSIIHILLVIAIIAILLNIIRGRSPL